MFFCDFGLVWVVFLTFGFFLLLEGHPGEQWRPDPPKDPKHNFTHVVLEVILESFWDLGGIKSRGEFCIFFKVHLEGFGLVLGPKGSQKGALGIYFGAFWRDKWKYENSALAYTGASL